MENNIDLYGFYHIDRSTNPATETFVRWNNNNPATLRQIVSMKHEVQYMASDVINIEVESVAPIGCVVGDYIMHAGCKFRLNTINPLQKTGERRLKYTYTFESVKYELVNVLWLLVQSDGTPLNDMPTDDFTGTMAEFLQMIVRNANRVYPNQWAVSNNLPASLPIEAKTLSYDGQNCLYVLQNVCEEWSEEQGQYEYVITEDAQTGVKTIQIVERDKTVSGNVIDNNGEPFRYGYGKGLYEISRNASNSDNIITKMFAFGSSDNLPARYIGTRLCLPSARDNNPNGISTINGVSYHTKGDKALSYKMDNTKTALYGVREGVVNFDEVKPHANWTVRSFTDTDPGNDGQFKIQLQELTSDTTQPAFDLKAEWQSYNSDNGKDYVEYLRFRNLQDNNIVAANYENYVVGTNKYWLSQPHIIFNTGDCAGMDFVVDDCSVRIDKIVVLTVHKNKDENAYNPDTDTMGIIYPNATIKPAVGDKFVITEIQLPWSYVTAAESTLNTKATEKYAEVSQPQASYSIKLANDFVLNTYGVHEADEFVCGKYLHIDDSDIGVNKKIRITQYSRDLVKGYEYDVTISDFTPKRLTSSTLLQEGIGAYNAPGNAITGVIGSNTPSPSLDMVFSADSSTLTFAASDPGQQNGIFEYPQANMRWIIPNGTRTLATDNEYWIVLQLPVTRSSENTNENFLQIKVTSPNRPLGSIYLSNNNSIYVVILGHISAKQIQSGGNGQVLVEYRTVEVEYGEVQNQLPVIGGGTIVSPTGNINIDVTNGQATFSSQAPTRRRSRSANATATLSITSSGVQLSGATTGRQEQSAIPCFRGNYADGSTYDIGDEVLFNAPNGNGTTTYRCIADGVEQSPTDAPGSWKALADFELGSNETWRAVELTQIDDTTWGQEATYQVGKTRLYVNGMRLFADIDYSENEDHTSVTINDDVEEGARVILEAVFE